MPFEFVWLFRCCVFSVLSKKMLKHSLNILYSTLESVISTLYSVHSI